MKDIKIKQLGNGGAFDYKLTNSSFLIETKEESYFLFDCGHSVYAELRKQDEAKEIDLNKLKYIYISHMDDDHIGSLKTLIYYMFFILKKRVHIIAYGAVFKELKTYLSDIDGIVENEVKIKDSLFNMLEIPSAEYLVLDSFNIKATFTNHFKPCFGLKFKLKDKSYFIISGDTKAYHGLIPELRDMNLKFAFHDFSNWNCKSSQVHCCEEDYNSIYDASIRLKIIKYHNSEDFKTEWRTLNEITDSLYEEIK